MYFADWALRFFIYSLAGWIIESVYATIIARRWVNRGFLNGPYCPIYGCGAVIILLALDSLRHNWLLLLITAIMLTTILEYLTGYVMEKAFKTCWWDYSKYHFNLHGRICLQTSLLWGGMCLVLVYGIEPQVSRILFSLKESLRPIIALVLIFALVIDLSLTVYHAASLNKRLAGLQILLLRTKEHYLEGNLRQRVTSIRHSLYEWRSQVKKVGAVQRRLLQAFPHIHSLKYPEAMQKLRDWMKKTGRLSPFTGSKIRNRKLRLHQKVQDKDKEC